MHASRITAALLALCAPLAIARAQNAPATIIHAENHFALTLFQRVATAPGSPGNLVLAPSSLYTALTMSLLGARGPTATAIANTLGAPRTNGTALLTALQKLNNIPHQADLGLLSANAIWVDQRSTPNPAFARAITRTGGTVQSVNFQNRSAASAQINQWASQHTNHLINQVITPANIGPDTRLTLTNAVYFHAGWSIPFTRAATKQGRFTLATGAHVTVPMMHQIITSVVATAPGVKILTLNYSGPASMTIILPDHAAGLPAIEAHLTPQRLDQWARTARETNVTLSLPRFTIGTTQTLNQTLAAIGMRSAFAPNADFSAMLTASSPPVHLSNVFQQAKIIVNEHGTKAAAVTVGEATVAMSAPSKLPSIRFDANHPFLYVIRSGPMILFIGRVTNPSR